MNESETRAEYIDPLLRASGWGVVEGSKVLREHRFTDGKIQPGGTRGKPEIADYILVYKNEKVAVIEAKRLEIAASEGVMQAKTYAQKLQIDYTYATNGKEIYQISMKTGKEEYIDQFPSPDELANKIATRHNQWQSTFSAITFANDHGAKTPRYYQEIAINTTLSAIANEKQRILLTLATGTGKTDIAVQITWKLFQSRWNLRRDASRRPRVLFLADRNILADQAFTRFGVFPEDALIRIKPQDIRKKGSVPTNGSIFFTIFQTFSSGPDNTPYYGDYPQDFFDCIIIDECHRGGANDESNWRGILEYFSPAVQIGLTATPKRKDNVDTYKYFGEPVYTYSLKDGINDGFLTPFKIKRVKTTLDDYIYTSDDKIIEGEIEEGKVYEESDFNRIIEIKEREEKRVDVIMSEINQHDKTIIFCANQEHAAAIRDLINQKKQSSLPDYCVRVTANDGEKGEQYLRDFQDNEMTIPTILTTSQKLSTGVDARNVRNIVLLRPVNSMIEFKQIIGRGTRTFDGKDYFTVYDFADAYKHFSDHEWDGEPIDQTTEKTENDDLVVKESKKDYALDDSEEEVLARKKIKIKLADGKERSIRHIIATSFWSADGKPISAQEFLQDIFGLLPDFFKSEEELRALWSDPFTRKGFLDQIAAAGYDKDKLSALQTMIDAQNSDLFDVLAYVSFAISPISREERVNRSKQVILFDLDQRQREFLEFVLSKYIDRGVEELDEEKLPQLLKLKYHTMDDAQKVLGNVENIRSTFFDFQKSLYKDTKSRQKARAS